MDPGGSDIPAAWGGALQQDLEQSNPAGLISLLPELGDFCFQLFSVPGAALHKEITKTRGRNLPSSFAGFYSTAEQTRDKKTPQYFSNFY